MVVPFCPVFLQAILAGAMALLSDPQFRLLRQLTFRRCRQCPCRLRRSDGVACTDRSSCRHNSAGRPSQSDRQFAGQWDPWRRLRGPACARSCLLRRWLRAALQLRPAALDRPHRPLPDTPDARTGLVPVFSGTVHSRAGSKSPFWLSGWFARSLITQCEKWECRARKKCVVIHYLFICCKSQARLNAQSRSAAPRLIPSISAASWCDRPAK